MASLREILKPFMLRRLKSDVGLEVPPKKEVIVYTPITELQHDLYTAILNRDLQTLSKIEEQDLIIPEVNGPRPKRNCVTQKLNMNGESSSTSISSEYSDDNSNHLYLARRALCNSA
ncbi:lymphoid-specific helicase [Cephus cinctus]|uniref:Lymphoid-specific helicase n=1 Tax=Cephus cinctus TaxID=211228 RepID=A0AAJ7BY15_CEPCN|nr:lymphoid-specific helicase [Cephus cinctus]